MTSREFLHRQSDKFTSKQKCTIIEFFITFSRFEFALIVSGKFQHREYAIADWRTFAAEIDDRYINGEKNAELNEAIDYILGNPPLFLGNQANEIRWEHRVFRGDTTEVFRLCEYIKSIRNNLFHGSKFNFRIDNDRDRDFQLVKSSLIILNYLLSLDEIVKRNFLEGAV